jgi:hypothetical protein
MHNRCNVDDVALNHVDQTVGKLLDKISTKPALDPSPHQRMFEDFIRGRLHAGKEGFPKTGPAVFVKCSGLAEFE